MAKEREMYKCKKCNNIVEVVRGGAGQLVCCGEQMQLLETKTVDEGKEKHVPVVESDGGTYTVKVGSTPHPMKPEHHIEFIELLTDAQIYRVHLAPEKAPEASFDVKGTVLGAREHCNVHGLWGTTQ